MPTDQHTQRPNDHPPDELDRICRQMLAETMRPCRELSRYERAADALEARDRNTVLATWRGHDQRPLRAI